MGELGDELSLPWVPWPTGTASPRVHRGASGPDQGRFRTVVYAGGDPLTRKPRYLRKTAATYRQAEVELTKLLSQVDEDRHPRTNVTIGQVLDMWLEVVELEDTTGQRYGA